MEKPRWPQPDEPIEVLYYVNTGNKLVEDWRPATCLASNERFVDARMADGTDQRLYRGYASFRVPLPPETRYPGHRLIKWLKRLIASHRG